ncbi:MAG: hypothetical protein Q4E31_02595 [Intestinibacter bartlettii]|uniref:hypothetical protein n=1 Tax=Intestinibacter bartlettii TaxID=261299 RepID=UPI0026EFABFE|nr:hypothetical protein [Intestinibacter bartlettii]MDO5009689.1 hypothetical protein [Intestinibacter bartlettii]
MNRKDTNNLGNDNLADGLDDCEIIDDYLYLNKNEEKEQEEVKVELKKEVSLEEIVQEQKNRKVEELKQQRQWGMDLDDFTFEKQESKDIEQLINIDGEILENYISGKSKFDSFDESIDVCIQLCKLFENVHNLGYCFNGITSKDVVVTYDNECKLKNTEKLVSQDNNECSINYEKTCAPEILTNQSKPNINTDKHSMAFLVFEVLFKADPFEGSKALDTVCYTKEDELKNYEEPIFIYSYKDRSNRPVYGVHSDLTKSWNEFYSDDIKIIFEQSFVDGINNPESRVGEKIFIDRLNEFKNVLDSNKDNREPINNVKQPSYNQNQYKNEKEVSKQKVVITDTNKGFEEKQKIIIIDKDKAQKPVKKPFVKFQLCITYSYASGANDDEILDLVAGTEIINSIVGYEEVKSTQLIGKVVQNTKNKNVLGLKNVSNHEWVATKGNSRSTIPPGKVLVIMDGVNVDFYPENKSITKTKWAIRKV